MRGWSALSTFAICMTLAGGCAPAPPPEPVARPAPEPHPWSVTTNDPEALEPAWLANGLIGIRLGRDGSGWDHEGWVLAGPRGPAPPASDAERRKLPFFTVDGYEQTGEERILPMPSPLAVDIRAGGERLAPKEAEAYGQTLDFRTGALETTWETPQMSVRVEAVVHPDDRALAARWTVTPRTSEAFEVRYRFPASPTAVATGRPGEWTGAFQLPAPGVPARARLSIRGQSRVEQDDDAERVVWRLRASADQPLVVEATLSFGPKGGEAPAPDDRFEAVAEAARVAWAQRWRTDIVIDGPVRDQQAVRSWLFYLRASVHPDAPMAVSPMGLSNTLYHGHVFWDADVWVFPALMLLDPVRAATIPRYRLRLAPAARRNYERWVREGRPTGTGHVRGGAPPRPDALMFPWESSVTGMETVPGPSRHQHHITGTVVLGLEKAAMLGLADPRRVREVGRGAAAFFLDRAERDDAGRLQILGTMSPDENFIGDNDLYTNLVAQRVVDRYLPPGTARPEFRLPRDPQGRFLTYDGDPLRSYKQAAAVLAIYPLQAPEAEARAREMMERFSGKVIEVGPAMADAVHATIWARLGEPEKAYAAWLESWQDFSASPLLLFSEKRPRARTYFTTGAGGALQTVLFGFLGLRMDESPPADGENEVQLRGGWLTVRPQLPPAWKSVHLKGLSVLGENYDLKVTRDTARLTKGEP
jgi:trehalose/maltose hydrolase-like predicted phosphorylase